MKIFPSLFLSALLASATVASASPPPYHLSPQNITAELTGTLTFYPDGGQPFKCKVIFYLKTLEHAAGITSVKLLHEKCLGLFFTGLPWGIGIIDAKSGQFGKVGFGGRGVDCSEYAEGFTDNGAGIWKMPAGNQCMSGHLTSTPPVTIVKK